MGNINIITVEKMHKNQLKQQRGGINVNFVCHRHAKKPVYYATQFLLKISQNNTLKTFATGTKCINYTK